jgi:hypothetical protein
MNTYEVLLAERVYGTVKVQAKTEEEAHHLALRSPAVKWDNPSNIEVIAARQITSK